MINLCVYLILVATISPQIYDLIILIIPAPPS